MHIALHFQNGLSNMQNKEKNLSDLLLNCVQLFDKLQLCPVQNRCWGIYHLRDRRARHVQGKSGDRRRGQQQGGVLADVPCVIPGK